MTKETNEFVVREKIITTTINILLTKKYNDVTVKEIIYSSQVSRSSFYRYFKSLNDIIEYTAKKLNTLFFNINTKNELQKDFTLKLFKFVTRYKSFYYCLYLNDLLHLSTKYALSFINKNDDKKDIRLQKSIFIHFIYALLEEWFKDGCKETPEEMQDYINNNKNMFLAFFDNHLTF